MKNSIFISTATIFIPLICCADQPIEALELSPSAETTGIEPGATKQTILRKHALAKQSVSDGPVSESANVYPVWNLQNTPEFCFHAGHFLLRTAGVTGKPTGSAKTTISNQRQAIEQLKQTA